ncbi:MAG TPA: glycosyltransferase [Longimicrobiales bacterium]|nr:glycosyltransferase [Longimicrobiales bacterium]
MPTESTSLVIPGRNVERTIRQCLDAAIPYLTDGRLKEIIFVDDGSSDGTLDIASAYPVSVVAAGGLGPGGARNVGWRASSGTTVWFMDADCVARRGALEVLQDHLRDPAVGGAGGSYANEVPHSLLATLIHEEIIERHRRMPERVGYLATYNVLYRREVLEQLDGFDETKFNARGKPGAEDIDFAYRAASAGWELRFDPRSVVGHHHPTRLLPYLRTQRNHGFWRVALHLQHRRQGAGDDYSGIVDHLQPVVAVAAALATALAFVGVPRVVPALLWGSLLALQLPMTARLIRRMPSLQALTYLPLGSLRALWRGLGMTAALLRQTVPSR